MYIMYIMDLKVEGEGEKEYREYPVYGAAQVTALIFELKWSTGIFSKEHWQCAVYGAVLVNSQNLTFEDKYGQNIKTVTQISCVLQRRYMKTSLIDTSCLCEM